MSEDREALLHHYRTMRAELLAAVDGLSDESMSEPSLDGWSVKDHLGHLALWDEMRAREVERISAGHDSACKMNGEQDAAYTAMGYDLRRGLSLAQVRWEFETSAPEAAGRYRGGDDARAGRFAVWRGARTEHARGSARRLDQRVAGQEGHVGATRPTGSRCRAANRGPSRVHPSDGR
jgi:hypothetical protein